MTDDDHPVILVLFGARGDLARRMLFPSLYRLAAAGRLPADHRIIGSGRSCPDSVEEFRDSVREGWSESIDDLDDAVVEGLLQRLSFQSADADDGADLAAAVASAQKELGEDVRTLIYLSVPPSAMKPMIAMLGREGMAEGARLIVEKPFGTDLDSSRELGAATESVADEQRIYRIDHFLGKEAVQNILALRFANGLIEPAWNRHHIESVQIDVPEDIALEGRGSFYESTGCFRDMVSTHLCQVLGFLAMEPPSALDADGLRNAKAQVFEDMRPLDPARVVFGQYAGYRDEDGVDDDSDVETFVALEAYVDNERWRDVPFYLRTGKAMGDNRRTVTLTFRTPPGELFGDTRRPDRLVLDLTETPTAQLALNVKRPGPELTVERVGVPVALTPDGTGGDGLDAYERLLLDVLRGDQTLFARGDEVDRLWQVCQPVLDDPPAVEAYDKGSWGPQSAVELPRSGWWLPDDD
ncbi:MULTISPECIES: glucose-6-phosphate dehydrogenase [Mycolicibacterium]|uniref:Glucose-6-phosphate 1-dehydrogenase n=2 Tax=Mycolicibacterium gilvum TaxID=1804 RepID=E6TNQ2_MYCSR|nr:MULTISPECIES: glucose-6-phosphate dehydrogenase [Mycolicibacterium]ABP42760.1 glucose-6-phosphate 1-dehydrogenase [Mycolicibacterium gilvum PYR-GCK]ADT97219.1 glucose-6-phosphate 1-dehydrogenase [Mycolicibacterium gilvum Spyr1]MBV5245239.1 glucose-6-phosphate dehydrogenase [Mycolicibacterium sp. PAM1]